MFDIVRQGFEKRVLRNGSWADLYILVFDKRTQLNIKHFKATDVFEVTLSFVFSKAISRLPFVTSDQADVDVLIRNLLAVHDAWTYQNPHRPGHFQDLRHFVQELTTAFHDQTNTHYANKYYAMKEGHEIFRASDQYFHYSIKRYNRAKFVFYIFETNTSGFDMTATDVELISMLAARYIDTHRWLGLEPVQLDRINSTLGASVIEHVRQHQERIKQQGKNASYFDVRNMIKLISDKVQLFYQALPRYQ